jgi:hypothetical protein
MRWRIASSGIRTKLLMCATPRSVLQARAVAGQNPPGSTPASAQNQL